MIIIKEKLRVFCVNAIAFIAMLLVIFLVVYGALIGIDLISRHFEFSTAVFKFRVNGDWLILGIMILTLVIGSLLIYTTYRNKRITIYRFLQRNMGLMLITATILLIFNQIVLSLTKQHFTADSIRKIAMWSKICYLTSYIGILVLLGCSIWMSRSWIKKNNWYIFWAFLGPLIYLQQVVNQNVSFNRFLSEDAVSYSKLALMFRQASAGGTPLDISMMNGSYIPAAKIMILVLVLILMIGGVHFVLQTRQKAVRKIKGKGKA